MKNFAMISVMEKLKSMTVTRWKDKLSAKLLQKVRSLAPRLEEVRLWPEKFSKQIVKQEAGADYKDDGVELYDYQGNKLDATQVVTGNLPDGSSPGEYLVTYDFTDAEGHKADQVSRLVKLPDTVPPVITLSGINPVTILLDYEYQDPGATAVDVVDGFTFSLQALW